MGVWFAGLRSESGGINGFKVGGELGSDRYRNAFGAVGRTPSPRGDFYGYYSQTLETGDPSVNHLVLVPDGGWVNEYTTTPELGAEGDITCMLCRPHFCSACTRSELRQAVVLHF